MKKKTKEIPVKTAILIIALSIAVFFIVRYVSFFLRSTDYFIIKDTASNNQNVDISYLKGRNIIFLDLKQESDKLRRAYPTYQKIIFIRQFPNRIVAILKNRIPLAWLRLSRDYLVDKEAVLFSSSINISDVPLPVITGLSDKINSPKEGLAYNIPDLNCALSLIAIMDRLNISKKYPLDRIVFSNNTQVSVFLNAGAEIKLSKSDIPRQMKNLVSLLGRARIDPAKVKYIDLRFKEPTVMFNEK